MNDGGLGRVLLAVARGAIAARFGRSSPRVEHAALAQPGASFVTLRQDDRLRGCIGSLEARRALGIDVAENACSAAFRDPRFAPLAPREFRTTVVEVSLLAPAEALECRDEEHLLAQLRPGIDGLVLSYGHRRGTFLPQVWDVLPDPRRFVRELKQKAGLAADFWHSALRVERYTVTKWSEEGDCADAGPATPGAGAGAVPHRPQTGRGGLHG